MEGLPAEILVRILGFLNVRDVIKFRVVSRVLHKVCRTELATRRHLTIRITGRKYQQPYTEKWPCIKGEWLLLTPICHTEKYGAWLVDLMPGIRYLRIQEWAEELYDVIEGLAPYLIELYIDCVGYQLCQYIRYYHITLIPHGVKYSSLLKLKILNFDSCTCVTNRIIGACPILQSLECDQLKVTKFPLSMRELECEVYVKQNTMDAILKLSNLTKLDIKISTHGYLNNLKILCLFSAFDKLEYLRCNIYPNLYSSPKMDDAVGELVMRNRGLKYIELKSFPSIGDRAIRYIAGLADLKTLIIDVSKITSDGVLSLFRGRHSRNLIKVDISYNNPELTETEKKEIMSVDRGTPCRFTFRGDNFYVNFSRVKFAISTQ